MMEELFDVRQHWQHPWEECMKYLLTRVLVIGIFRFPSVEVLLNCIMASIASYVLSVLYFWFSCVNMSALLWKVRGQKFQIGNYCMESSIRLNQNKVRILLSALSRFFRSDLSHQQ